MSPLSRHARHVLATVLCLSAFTLAGCTVPVAAGVDEGDANRIVVALDRVGIDATKDIDPTADGRFRIAVARDDAARALVTMQADGLPRPNPSGVMASLDKGALVPSRAAEHAQFVSGLGGDLERTLESVDGVLAAHVHLNLPPPDPFRPADALAGKATASVLVEHRGPVPPLAPPAIQSLVAGGVAGLAPADVSVVLVERAAAPLDAPALAHLGPIAVARGSLRALQVSLGALLAVVAALAAATLSLYGRLSRLRAVGEGKAT
jgi:type III secretion protein J